MACLIFFIFFLFIFRREAIANYFSMKFNIITCNNLCTVLSRSQTLTAVSCCSKHFFVDPNFLFINKILFGATKFALLFYKQLLYPYFNIWSNNFNIWSNNYSYNCYVDIFLYAVAPT